MIEYNTNNSSYYDKYIKYKKKYIDLKQKAGSSTSVSQNERQGKIQKLNPFQTPRFSIKPRDMVAFGFVNLVFGVFDVSMNLYVVNYPIVMNKMTYRRTDNAFGKERTRMIQNNSWNLDPSGIYNRLGDFSKEASKSDLNNLKDFQNQLLQIDTINNFRFNDYKLVNIINDIFTSIDISNNRISVTTSTIPSGFPGK